MNQIRVKLPGSSDRGIKAELFDVLDEFFRDSSAWVETVPLNLVSGTTIYSVIPADDGKVIALAGILDGNQQVVPAVVVDITTPGVSIQLRDNPNQSTTVTAYLVKSIVLPTTTDAIPIAPEWVLSHYNNCIEDGMLARLMMQKNKPYSDINTASYHGKRFRNSIAEARAQALRRYTFGTQSWTYPGQFAVSTQRGGVSIGGTDTRFF